MADGPAAHAQREICNACGQPLPEATSSLPRPSVRAIQRAVARSAHVPLSAIAGRCRRREHAHARQLAMWLAYHLRADMSYPALGRLFGGRDHTTIMYGVAQTAARVGARTPGDVWRDINRGSVESGNQGMA